MDYNHLRILQVRLQLIEFYLRIMLNKLKQDPEDSSFLLYSFKNDMDQEIKIRMTKHINHILGHINQLKEKFELKSEERSFVHSIMMDMVEISATLSDTKPERFIDDYGDIPFSEEKLLRHHILDMIHIMDNMYIELGYEN